MKPVISALGLFAAGSLMYLMKSYITEQQPILDKLLLKQLLVTLRKRLFPTLREIAFVVNSIKATEADFEPKKISEIVMKDGGSGDAKLKMIEQLTIKSYNLTRQSFQSSCNFYKVNDYEIRMILKNLNLDVELALSGTIQPYNGPIPLMSQQKVIYMYRQILRRRMQIIKQKMMNDLTNEQCIKRQFEIEQFLELNGVSHGQEANEKLFICVLEKCYRENADFRVQFEQMEIEMAEFTEDIVREQERRYQHQQGGKNNKEKTVTSQAQKENNQKHNNKDTNSISGNINIMDGRISL